MKKKKKDKTTEQFSSNLTNFAGIQSENPPTVY